MRVALHATGPVGQRAGRVLLAESGLDRLAVWHSGRPAQGGDSRVRFTEDLVDVDLLASDDTEHPERAARAALEAGVSCALAADTGRARRAADRLADDFSEAGLTLLLGANLRSGIAPALAAHESAQCGVVLEVMVAWTEEGKARRRGEAVPFPGPVGSLWGAPADILWPQEDDQPVQGFAAPLEGRWAGAMARVHGIVDDGVITRIVGAADDGDHLAALALAAASLAVARHNFPPGVCWVSEAPEPFLDGALAAGLEVATYTIRSADTH